MREAITHVNAILAVELHECQRNIGRLNALQNIACHAIGTAVATLLFSTLLAALRTRHVGEVYAEYLAVLQTQNQLLTRCVVLLNLGFTKRRINQGLFLRRATLKVFVRLKLVTQAAHQATAHARDFCRIKRQVLLFGHTNRDWLKLPAKTCAAQLLTAVGVATHQACLVTHANLAHIHAGMEARGKIFDQLAEVNAILGSKIEDNLLATKEVLHAHRLHIQVVLLYQATELRHGLVSALSKLVSLVKVSIGSNAQYGFKGAYNLRLGNLKGIRGHQANLGSALS